MFSNYLKFSLSLLLCGISVVSLLALKPDQHNKNHNNLTSENIKGRVKLITEYGYGKDDVKDINKAMWAYKTRKSFNMQGNITTMELYNDHTTGHYTTITYTYDAEGRKALTKRLPDHVMSTSTYNYNLKHQLVEDITSGSHVSFHIIYNEKGNRDTTYAYNVLGKLYNKTIYHYDSNDDTIEEDRYKPTGELSGKKTYRYDNRHNMIEEAWFNKNAERTSMIIHQYDYQNNEIRTTYSSMMFINSVNNSIANQTKNTTTHTYKNFDKNANWLQKEESSSGRVIRVIKREIEYY